MSCEKLKIIREPVLQNPTILMGLTGWMDGGNVSSATIKYFQDKLYAEKIAYIDPCGFYIQNIPGSMEVSSIFRPHAQIRNGIITSYDSPVNDFYLDPHNNIILFLGTEPNLLWADYSDCIFSVCEKFGVKTIYFIGSVAGLVPHTRQPRLSCSISDEKLRDRMVKFGLKFSNYDGPASIVTKLTKDAAEHGIEMAVLVAEIPAYIHGHNPQCIDSVAKRLAVMMGMKLDHQDLRLLADQFERKVSDVIGQQPELAEHIKKLEQDYDNEVFDNEMSDMKDFLKEKGIRVD